MALDQVSEADLRLRVAALLAACGDVEADEYEMQVLAIDFIRDYLNGTRGSEQRGR